MTDHPSRFDIWRIPTLFLWWLFLVVGALPEESFWAAREISGVVTQRAMVNSPSLITLAFSLYLGFFSYRQCRESGLSSSVSQGRAIQQVILGLIAFLPFPLARLLEVREISAYSFWDTVYIRGAVYAVWVGKSVSLLYLAGLFFRLYALGNATVYRNTFTVFPSARSEEAPSAAVEEDLSLPSPAAPLKDGAEKNCN